jgi:hypothetical protein
MYEMEGPRSVAQPSTPIAQLPVARLLSAADLTTSAAHPPGTSVARRSLRSGVSPGVPESPPDRHPCLVVSAFLLPIRGPAQGIPASNLKIL